MPNINNMKFSIDGLSWTSASVNVSTTFEQGLIENDITSIDNANYIWGAVGKNGLVLKSNQLTNSLGTFDVVANEVIIAWTTQNSNFGTTTINSVAYDNGLWVAAGYSGQLRTSTETLSYTLQLSDNKSVIETNKTSANTVIVPLNSSVAFPIGSSIDIVQTGVGQTTITPAEGVTIKSSNSETKLTGQYSGSTIYKRATNEWVLFGDLSA